MVLWLSSPGLQYSSQKPISAFAETILLIEFRKENKKNTCSGTLRDIMTNRARRRRTPAEITDYIAKLVERDGLEEAEMTIRLSDWPKDAKEIAWKEIAVRRKLEEG